MSGTLYMIPTPLSSTPVDRVLPAAVKEACHRLRHFVVENERTARRFLKSVEKATAPGEERSVIDINALTFGELSEHTKPEAVAALLPAEGDVGMMSEAGCPGVADPGALLAAEAQRRGMRVVPLAGPSAILMSLMASGLDGQNFAFLGYLPIGDKLPATLRQMEQRSRTEGQTQICIEAPYRNGKLFEELLRTLHGETRLCVARDVTGERELIVTRTVEQWRQVTMPELHKIPTVFLFRAL